MKQRRKKCRCNQHDSVRPRANPRPRSELWQHVIEAVVLFFNKIIEEIATRVIAKLFELASHFWTATAESPEKCADLLPFLSPLFC